MNLDNDQQGDAGTNGTTATIDNGSDSGYNMANPPGAPPPDFLSLVPQEYRETEDVKNLAKTENPIQELFKQRYELQKMIGSRPTPPGEDATPEQIADWNKSIGVPEDPNAYEYEALNWEELGAQPIDKPVIEFLNSTREGPMAEMMKGVFQKAGLRPDQAKFIQKGFELATMANHRDQLQATIEGMKTADQQYMDYMNKAHGQNANAVIDAAGKFAQKHMPPELHALLPKLSGEQLGMLSTMLYTSLNKFVREDGSVNSGSNVNTSSNLDPQKISERGRQLMSHPAYFDSSLPEHDSIVRQVNENYEQLRLLNEQGR